VAFGLSLTLLALWVANGACNEHRATRYRVVVLTSFIGPLDYDLHISLSDN
jgi:hypothetical protein